MWECIRNKKNRCLQTFGQSVELLTESFVKNSAVVCSLVLTSEDTGRDLTYYQDMSHLVPAFARVASYNVEATAVYTNTQMRRGGEVGSVSSINI